MGLLNLVIPRITTLRRRLLEPMESCKCLGSRSQYESRLAICGLYDKLRGRFHLIYSNELNNDKQSLFSSPISERLYRFTRFIFMAD